MQGYIKTKKEFNCQNVNTIIKELTIIYPTAESSDSV